MEAPGSSGHFGGSPEGLVREVLRREESRLGREGEGCCPACLRNPGKTPEFPLSLPPLGGDHWAREGLKLLLRFLGPPGANAEAFLLSFHGGSALAFAGNGRSQEGMQGDSRRPEADMLFVGGSDWEVVLGWGVISEVANTLSAVKILR